MIEVKHLVKRYGDFEAVRDVSFTVEKGRIYGFLGPNGAGKSTTMNIITGCLAATEGEVTIGGYDIYEDPVEAKSCIGYLPEIPPLYTDMTPDEYLTFVGRAKGLRGEALEKAVDKVIAKTSLTPMRDRLIKNLSKGYKQRVGIAQALVGNPPVIIFDEPTVGLDPKQIIEIRNLIRNLGQNHTVILSTHILSEVQAICDRIVIINEGKIIADEKTENITRVVEENRKYSVKVCGPQREVLSVIQALPGVVSAEATGERDGDSYTFHIEGEKGTDLRKPLFYAMSERNWPIIGLEAVSMNLEEVFLKIMDADLTRRR